MRAVRIMLIILLPKVTVVTLYVRLVIDDTFDEDQLPGHTLYIDNWNIDNTKIIYDIIV